MLDVWCDNFRSFSVHPGEPCGTRPKGEHRETKHTNIVLIWAKYVCEEYAHQTLNKHARDDDDVS